MYCTSFIKYFYLGILVCNDIIIVIFLHNNFLFQTYLYYFIVRQKKVSFFEFYYFYIVFFYNPLKFKLRWYFIMYSFIFLFKI